MKPNPKTRRKPPAGRPDTQAVERIRWGLGTAMARHRVRVEIMRWFAEHAGHAGGLRGLVAATRYERRDIEAAVAELLAAGELELAQTGYRAKRRAAP